MINWREKIWIKIIALTIAGVFLFSEVTWAARADFRLSLPGENPTANTQTPQPSLGDFLWQIYHEVTSFLIPKAFADENTNPYPYHKGDIRKIVAPQQPVHLQL